MMNRRCMMFLMAASLLLVGCGDEHADIRARYSLEKQLWEAQLRERKININFVQGARTELDLAIREFERVVSYEPPAMGDTQRWDPEVLEDIRRIQLVSRIGLASLYFLAQQYTDAGRQYETTLETFELPLAKRLDVRLSLARALYISGEEESFESQFGEMFREIVGSDEFWGGGIQLKEVFLNIPLVLVNTYLERGNESKYREYADLAEDFYERIRTSWPDSAVVRSASFSMIRLRLVEERWRDALREVDALLGQPLDAPARGGLLLLKGEIQFYALGDKRSSIATFAAVARAYPDSPVSYAALLNQAQVYIESGKAASGIEMLKSIETADGAPRDVKSRAMITRAQYLESTGEWPEALNMLRRVSLLYPNTNAAMEAPLLITAHYAARGDSVTARRNLERAKNFYVSLLSKSSEFTGNKLLVEDYLIENYLMTGMAEDVVSILETQHVNWDDASSAGGLYRCALIYLHVLDDRGGAARTFKKCIELYPETRYAKMAQANLKKLGESP